ncbi:NADH-quinone oxidoreductase subunit NuoK [Catalinimonas niigatensis]|uniref:NADH-quinone oxidoreductase subunit NuoK n=1 Tax=Catalinimonas niigatensis TaxID=1397264 RepID=UPI002666A9A6|nr:NADH-quinone oxidoreductase subunit NuoK [Catalinimonas niigatensis]WPP51656.1 NADH-quinone oxidoreductase subunit NuoK [Catalinimonas niigatensis]
MIPLEHYLILSALLLCIGLTIIIVKKNAIVVLMGIELIFNAANINLVAFSKYDASLLQGQMFALFVIIIAAAEAAVAMAIVLKIYNFYHTSNLNEVNAMKE